MWRPPFLLRLAAGNLLVFLALFASSWGALETYLRLGRDATDSYSQTLSSRRWFARHYRRNNLGFRDDEDYAPKRRPGRPRVSFVGDSFTAGHGVARVADRFVNLVRARNPTWEVHALAENGVNTTEELDLVRDQIARGYELDRVVLVYCLNDIEDYMDPAMVPQPPPPPTGLWGALVERSFAANYVHFRLRARFDPNVRRYGEEVGAAFQGEPWVRQQRDLLELRDACRNAGGRLFVVIFPFLHGFPRDYAFREAHRRVGGFLESAGVPVLDLLSVFEAHASEPLTVNAFDAHPNERAHALAAAELAPWLSSTAGAAIVATH